VRNRARLAALIESVLRDRPRREWLALLDANEIPSGPINNYEQVFADPHIQARGLIVEIEHPTLGRIRTLGPPVKMSGTQAITGRRAPLLGEHTTEILRELGIEN